MHNYFPDIYLTVRIAQMTAATLLPLRHQDHPNSPTWHCCLMAGVLQLVPGIFKPGSIVKLLSRPMNVCFANTASLIHHINAGDGFARVDTKQLTVNRDLFIRASAYIARKFYFLPVYIVAKLTSTIRLRRL